MFSKGVCILDKDVARVKVTMHKVFNKNLPIQNKKQILNIQHHKFTDSLLCIHTVLTPYKNGSSDAAANDRGSYRQRQRQLLRRNFEQTLPCTIDDHKLFTKIWIHTSAHIIINTDSKEETEKSGKGRGH